MNLPPKNVLIVEDDYLLAMVAERLIQKIGHKVVAKVNNGQDAIAAVEEKHPDVVLMDIRLNGEMDGIETVQQIKKISSLPVIYLSGNSYSKGYGEDEETSQSVFLQKPLQIQELKKAFQDIFDAKKYLFLIARKILVKLKV